MNMLTAVMEAIALNHIADHELLNQLIQAFLKTRDGAITELQRKVAQHEDELGEIKKNKEAIKSAENFINKGDESFIQ